MLRLASSVYLRKLWCCVVQRGRGIMQQRRGLASAVLQQRCGKGCVLCRAGMAACIVCVTAETRLCSTARLAGMVCAPYHAAAVGASLPVRPYCKGLYFPVRPNWKGLVYFASAMWRYRLRCGRDCKVVR